MPVRPIDGIGVEVMQAPSILILNDGGAVAPMPLLLHQLFLVAVVGFNLQFIRSASL